MAKPNKPKGELNVRDKAVCMAYLDKDNPETYGNGTRSVMAVYKAKSYGAASTKANAMLRKPEIRTYIEALFAETETAIQDRARLLSRIAHGVDRRRTESYGVGEDGQERLQGVTVAGPTYRERLQAIDMISRLTGDYDRAGQAVKIEADEYRRLVREVFRDVTGGGGGRSPRRAKKSLIPALPAAKNKSLGDSSDGNDVILRSISEDGSEGCFGASGGDSEGMENNSDISGGSGNGEGTKSED